MKLSWRFTGLRRHLTSQEELTIARAAHPRLFACPASRLASRDPIQAAKRRTGAYTALVFSMVTKPAPTESLTASDLATPAVEAESDWSESHQDLQYTG